MMKKLLKMSRSELMSVLRAVVIALCAYFVLFALVSAAVTPQRYDIQVGAPAPVQLLATKDVEDTVTTQALREAAANDVAPSYKSADPQVTMQVMADIEEQLSLLYAMNQTSGESVQAEFALSEDQRRALLSAAADALDRLFARAESLTRDALLSTIPEGQEDATLARIERDLNADGYEQTLVSIAMGVVG